MQGLIPALIADPERTNALAAVANVMLAGLALVVAVSSIVLSILALRRQTLHNKLSVRPIPSITPSDHLESIWVKIFNYGSGPLIVKGISISNGQETKRDLIYWMPRPPEGIYWSNFTVGGIGRSIQPGDNLLLIQLDGNHEDPLFLDFRSQCRRALKDLTVTLEYTDIYDDDFPKCVASLSWFGRG